MNNLVEFYARNLRPSLFTGFLTLTGFLFTLHTFLLVTLHRDIYGLADYQKWVIERRKYSPALSPLRPLRNVSKLLFLTLCSSFITSVSQLTIGLVRQNWAVIVCLTFAALSIALFVFMLCVLRLVIRNWLDFVESNAEKKFGGEQPDAETT